MADAKISELPAASTPLAGTELVPLVQGTTTESAPASAIGRLQWAHRKVGIWSANGNGTGVSTINFGASNTGTPTARNIANTNSFTMMRRLGFPTATGSVCGTRHNSLQFNRDAGFDYVARVGVASLPSSGFHVLFVGFNSTTNNAAQVGSGSGAGFGLRLVGGTSPNAWYPTSAALSADTATNGESLSGTDFPVNTGSVDMYEIRLFCAPGGSAVDWTVTRLTGGSGQTTSGSISTALPASNVLLSPIISGACQTPNTGFAIDVVSQFVETDL